jgi:hypothetical protein
MVKINLFQGWRKKLRQTEMAREICHYSLFFLCLTLLFCAFVVLKTIWR